MVFVQLYLLQTNSSFLLRFSELQGMFNLGQICQNSEAKFQSVISIMCQPITARVVWKLYYKLLYKTLDYNALHCIAFHSNTLDCITFHYVKLSWTALHYNALPDIAFYTTYNCCIKLFVYNNTNIWTLRKLLTSYLQR